MAFVVDGSVERCDSDADPKWDGSSLMSEGPSSKSSSSAASIISSISLITSSALFTGS